MGLFRTITRKMRHRKYGRHKVSLTELGSVSEASPTDNATQTKADTAEDEEEQETVSPLRLVNITPPTPKKNQPSVTSSRPHSRIEKAFKELAEQTSNAS